MKFYKICYAIIVCGVILNIFFTFPWEGLEYSIGDDITLNASRYWTTGGVKRIAGFSRASFNVASQVVIFSLVLISNTEKKYKKILIYLFTSYMIWLTTTKGMLIAYIIVAFTDLSFIRNKTIICKIIATVGVVLMVGLPIFSTVCDPVFGFLKENIDGPTYWRYFQSFEFRIKGTWPDSFDKVSKEGNMITGKGFGGIGSAEQFYGKSVTTPGDNVFVYLYAIIGVISIPFILWIFYKTYKLKSNLKEEKNIYNIILIMFYYGIISNIFEEPMLCIYLGACIGYFINNNLRIGAEDENTDS